MSGVRFGLVFVVVVVVVEGYYHGEYFPEERNFRGRKGDDNSPILAQDVSRPHKWLRLRQRSEGLLDAYRQRGYNIPYRQRTTYRGSYQNSPRTNIQQPGWQTYNQETRHYVKGPRTSSRNEYSRTSGRYVYPQETVEETARRFVNVRPDYTDRQDRTRKKNQKRKPNNRQTSSTKYNAQSRSTIRRNNRQTFSARTTPSATTTGSYQGCRDTGMYCTFWKTIGCCEKELGRKYCKKTCGFCSPHQAVCPSSYKYGCCFNGREALDPYKSNCPRCRDKSLYICKRPVVYQDCDLHSKNTLETRVLCPQTCGACYDYSNTT